MSDTPTIPKPTVGRIVHYVVKDGQRPGETRAAIITRTFHQPDHVNYAVNLTVFPDHSNPSLYEEISASSSLYDDTGKPGTWSYPQKEFLAENLAESLKPEDPAYIKQIVDEALKAKTPEKAPPPDKAALKKIVAELLKEMLPPKNA